MARGLGLLVTVLLLGLWVSSGLRHQPQVKVEQATAVAQLTAVAKPTTSR